MSAMLDLGRNARSRAESAMRPKKGNGVTRSKTFLSIKPKLLVQDNHEELQFHPAAILFVDQSVHLPLGLHSGS